MIAFDFQTIQIIVFFSFSEVVACLAVLGGFTETLKAGLEVRKADRQQEPIL